MSVVDLPTIFSLHAGPTPPPGVCEEGEYRCQDKTCIPQEYVCDGGKDCPGGEDEKSCPPDGSGSGCKEPPLLHTTAFTW